MSEFKIETIMVYKRFRHKDISLEDAINELALQYKECQFREIVWDLSILLRQNGFTKEAFICLEELIKATDDSELLAQLYMTLGQFMEKMDDFGAAILYYYHAVSLRPTDKHTSYFINNNLGYCLNLLGKHEEAEGYCRTAINIDA